MHYRSCYEQVDLPIILKSASDLGKSGMSKFSALVAASAAMATRLPACFCRIESAVL